MGEKAKTQESRPCAGLCAALREPLPMNAPPLPEGSAPSPVPLPHFPDRLHAFVWRNWPLVPHERIAAVLGARPAEVAALARSMGLGAPPRIPADQIRRSALTVIRRNWHLIPYPQLLQLLDWSAERLAYTLQEDDFLFIKLGSLKPRCAPLRWSPPTPEQKRRADAIRKVVRTHFGGDLGPGREPLFGFLPALAAPPARTRPAPKSALSPRFCYPYFALYGDPLRDEGADLLPDGYLARMAEAGVDGIWLQGVLSLLAPFPWEPRRSDGWQERRANLRKIARQAAARGIGIWIYLNEPRTLPNAFFDTRPELKGVVHGDHACLCVSAPDVRRYLVEAVESLCRDVPELGGIFTISASENPTNCFSHGRGGECPRCGPRGAAAVIADTNAALADGVRRAGTATRFIAWDWGWPDDQAAGIIERLPDNVAVQSVSEWSLPIERGGVKSVVGEYSLSAVGPGPRATRHWEWARRRGLKTVAKTQLAVTWELGSVPYIPAVENAARHAANLRAAKVDGIMLGWTLGGYPSPNLEAVAAVGAQAVPDPDAAMATVATRRFGARSAPAAVAAWKTMSAAFSEFPFHISTVYSGPMHFGPSNLLWEAPTGYAATMVGIPYDDLDQWRAVFPPEVFAGQLEKVAAGFASGAATLRAAARGTRGANRDALLSEAGVADACALHFGSAARQARFVLARRAALAGGPDAAKAAADLERLLDDEIAAARRLHALQSADSRIGFEASNQYYYVPVDLVEKVVNAVDLKERWLPTLGR